MLARFQEPGVVKQSTLEVVEIIITANHRITGDDHSAADQGFNLSYIYKRRNEGDKTRL